jgi:MoxR-like ATPase
MAYDVPGLAREIIAQVEKIIVGKSGQIKLMVMAIFSEGHILLEDAPGVGKTTLVKALSLVLGCDFKRIQFTPDLLPSDVVGMNIYNQKKCEFELTIDGTTYALRAPFVVMATQNPVESESTFHLPAAQMDRFLIRLSLGYPDKREEARMLRILGDDIPFGEIKTLTTAEKIAQIQKEVQAVSVCDEVLDYALELVIATRKHPMIRLGASPRASRALFKASKALAAINGRDFVTPDDIQTVAGPVLCHRVMLSNEARFAGKTAGDLIEEIVSAAPVPPGHGGAFAVR